MNKLGLGPSVNETGLSQHPRHCQSTGDVDPRSKGAGSLEAHKVSLVGERHWQHPGDTEREYQRDGAEPT